MKPKKQLCVGPEPLLGSGPLFATVEAGLMTDRFGYLSRGFGWRNRCFPLAAPTRWFAFSLSLSLPHYRLGVNSGYPKTQCLLGYFSCIALLQPPKRQTFPPKSKPERERPRRQPSNAFTSHGMPVAACIGAGNASVGGPAEWAYEGRGSTAAS